MLAELMGKETGACRGRGGSMHVADPALGIFGANGVVGAGLPIAVGAAHALKRRGAGQVAIAFFGDGAVATGAFHEAVNLAALWRLPVMFLCENNGFSEFSRTADQHPVPIAQRADGYGVPFRSVHGNDVEATRGGPGRGARARCGPARPVPASRRLPSGCTGTTKGTRSGTGSEPNWPRRVPTDPLLLARKRLAELGAADAEVSRDRPAGGSGGRRRRAVRPALTRARRRMQLLDDVISPDRPRPAPAGPAGARPGHEQDPESARYRCPGHPAGAA